MQYLLQYLVLTLDCKSGLDFTSHTPLAILYKSVIIFLYVDAVSTVMEGELDV